MTHAAPLRQLVLFYSLTGKTRAYADAQAARMDAAIIEITEKKRRGKFSAYTSGCWQALRGQPSPIRMPRIRWDRYDRITLMTPVWAGRQTPAINAAIDRLPPGKTIDIVLISRSSHVNETAMAERIRARGCQVGTVMSVRL